MTCACYDHYSYRCIIIPIDIFVWICYFYKKVNVFAYKEILDDVIVVNEVDIIFKKRDNIRFWRSQHCFFPHKVARIRNVSKNMTILKKCSLILDSQIHIEKWATCLLSLIFNRFFPQIITVPIIKLFKRWSLPWFLIRRMLYADQHPLLVMNWLKVVFFVTNPDGAPAPDGFGALSHLLGFKLSSKMFIILCCISFIKIGFFVIWTQVLLL